jgi:hypothetical protein
VKNKRQNRRKSVNNNPGTNINFAPAVTPASAFVMVLTNLHEQEEARKPELANAG